MHFPFNSGALEPEAKLEAENGNTSFAVQLSAAISLKRIADMLALASGPDNIKVLARILSEPKP